MLQIVWSQSLEGQRPDLLLGEDRLLLHYEVAGGPQGATEMVCYALDGGERWSQPDRTVLHALPGDRFLVNTPEGSPLVLDRDGRVLHRLAFGGVQQAERHGDVLLFAGERQVWAADQNLRELWEIPWPGPAAPMLDCFADGVLYWVAGDCLRCCTPGGRSQALCRLPEDLVAGAMDEHEQATGHSALSGWYASPGMAGPAAFRMGDRPFWFNWRVAFEADKGQFFLANAAAPHLLLCLEASGRPQWCRYLSCGCCGGLPGRLPNGLYVANSGCGGILSWLDGEGNLLYQSIPHAGVGLATAYTSDVRVLPAGRCLADGGPGLVAYDAEGQRLWVFERGYSRFHCDPARGFLVGCYWRKDEPEGPSRVCLELVAGL